MMKLLIIAATTTLLTAAALAQDHDQAPDHFAFEDVEWTYAPLPGLALAQAWGDAETGEAWLLKLDPGVEIPRHTHSHDYWGLGVQGTWVHIDAEGAEVASGPGDYSLIHAGEVHADRCDGDAPCIALLSFVDGPRQTTLAE